MIISSRYIETREMMLPSERQTKTSSSSSRKKKKKNVWWKSIKWKERIYKKEKTKKEINGRRVAIGSLRIQLASGFSLTAFSPPPPHPTFLCSCISLPLSQLSLVISWHPTCIQQSRCLLHILSYSLHHFIVTELNAQHLCRDDFNQHVPDVVKLSDIII